MGVFNKIEANSDVVFSSDDIDCVAFIVAFLIDDFNDCYVSLRRQAIVMSLAH